jgi:hypothetical protein
MPTAKVKPHDIGKTRFRKRVETASPDYELGIKQTPRSWLDEFTDAADRIQEGLRMAADQLLFLKGAQRVGNKKWLERTLRKGPARYRDEAPKSADTWLNEVKDFLNEIGNIPLEKKKRKGDPANVIGRVVPIATRLHKLRLQKRGVTIEGE